jgi:hypothetical protein
MSRGRFKRKINKASDKGKDKNKLIFVSITLLIGATIVFLVLKPVPFFLEIFNKKTEEIIQVPFKVTASCRQPPGWNATFDILIDGKQVGVIDNCGSTEVQIISGKHKVKITGLVVDPENLEHTLESPETENDINKICKFIIYPMRTPDGVFTVTFIESCNS